jgi:hypothetical protein
MLTRAQNTKKVLLLRPQLKDNGDFASNTYVDTSGWGYLEILFLVGNTDVAAGDAIGSTAEGTAPLVEECDTAGGTYAAITGAALADSIQYDDDAELKQIDVNLQDGTYKRYMRVQAPHSAAGAAVGSNLAILAILSNPLSGPVDATGRGLTEHVIV